MSAFNDPGMSFRKTGLWTRAFGERESDLYAVERERLRQTLERMRERAGLLANEISSDVRELTVHDLSHSDALWDVADTIIGDEFDLNPLETFALGAAFLLHDLGMGLAAYPDGLESLRRKPLWPGMLRNFFKSRYSRSPTPEEIEDPPIEVLRRTQFEMLRLLHAERAAKLLETTWIGPTGTQYTLLEDPELRLALGFTIGQIAYSHWWSADDLPERLSVPLGPPVSLPRFWNVNTLVLALVLRTADAAHIDARRAPAFLRVLRRPDADSDVHWAFQEKMNRVQRDGDRLLYTSRPFGFSEATAWWLCADTLQMIDSELRKADNLLADRRQARFAARGVVATDDLIALSKSIPTDGWSPVNAIVHVSSVDSLVSRLGGRELYGDNNCVPIRELLQNAADAIEARRIVQGKPAWGEITLTHGVDANGAWIQVEDDGVGMSANTLTDTLLDFGKSFWSTTQSVIDFPALSAVEFRSIGKFGIGFFSVFMLGSRVNVTSRRFDRAIEDTNILSFDRGVSSRPILRKAAPDECLQDGGTRVRVWLKGIDDASSQWLRLGSSSFGAPRGAMSPQSYAAWLCVYLGIKVVWKGSTATTLVDIVDWRSVKNADFHSWSTNPRYPKETLKALAHIRPMRDRNGQVVGRAAISPDTSLGWIMVGGMRAYAMYDFVGVFEGQPTRASRERCWIDVPEAEVARWANEQVKLVAKNFDVLEQMNCSRQLNELGGDTRKLILCARREEFLNERDLIDRVRKLDKICIVSSFEITRIMANFGFGMLADNVFFEPSSSSHTSEFFRTGRPSWHPPDIDETFSIEWESRGYDITSAEARFGRPLLQAIAKAWGTTVPELFVYEAFEENIGANDPYLIDTLQIVERSAPE